MTADLPVRSPQALPASVDGPCADLRAAALDVALAGLAAADPGAATRRTVAYLPESDMLRVDGTSYSLGGGSRVFVVGAGKASYPIAAALEDILSDRLAGGVVAVRDPALTSLDHIRVVCSDHPLPTDRSVDAATQILATAHAAGQGDVVLACFTGGSSALASLPPPQVPDADKRRLHELLLSSGLSITDINAVRKEVSAIKGGRVALAAAPARIVNLTVSDVAGSPLDAVTDPSVQDTSSAAQARETLVASGLWPQLPASICEHLAVDQATPVVGYEPQTVMLADGASTLSAMATAARAAGYRTVSVEEELEGEAEYLGPLLARQLLAELERTPDESVALLGCGGEAVVSLEESGMFSRGGPNQHAALRAAEVISGRRAVALFIDTDGSDGGTELAGGLVDGATAGRAVTLDIDLAETLRRRTSTGACRALDAAVRTGHTGTNVNDLFVLIAESGGLP